MVKTLKAIKSAVWVPNVVEDLLKIRNHLKLYLEFYTLHKQVKNYLADTREEVQNSNTVAVIVKNVINVIPTDVLDLLGVKDRKVVSMDADTCTNEHKS